MTSPWKDYPVVADDNDDDPYKPSPLAQALGGGIIALVIILALYGAADIISRLMS